MASIKYDIRRRKGRWECALHLEGAPDEGDLQWIAEPHVGPFKKTSPRDAILYLGHEEPTQAFTVKVMAGQETRAEVKVKPTGAAAAGELPEARRLMSAAGDGRKRVDVTMDRSARPETPDQILWVLIRNSARALAFPNYVRFMDHVFCAKPFDPADPVDGFPDLTHMTPIDPRVRPLRLPFPGVDPYRLVKVATEVFVESRCCVWDNGRYHADIFDLLNIDEAEEAERGVPPPYDLGKLIDYFDSDDDPRRILPYLAIVLSKLPDVEVLDSPVDGVDPKLVARCRGVLQRKLAFPCLIELIWSYWHEEGMLAQTMNAISQRFQNLRAPGGRDPLSQLEIDPLRPLNNLLWGYVQDEQHRLSVLRRAHEYDHHYGFPLYGRAVADLRTADRRSKFLESFHNLLYRCAQFYREDDDTTVIADAFAVMNAIKETHYLLAQGAHNQFGDLPATSREEMLIEQWLLARPEMREFLGGRIMVPYPEPWMDRVDTVKTLKGWTDISVVHFHDLAVYGEQILLSIRYGAWSVVDNPNQAANWARYWRHEIQGYIHNYRAATGVDVSADITDQQELALRYFAPSVHLRNRLAMQLQPARTMALPPAGARTQVRTGRVSVQVERETE